MNGEPHALRGARAVRRAAGGDGAGAFRLPRLRSTLLSFRDIEDLLAERGIVVSYETIRNWCSKFRPAYAQIIKKRRGSLGDTWYMDEVYIVTVRGERRYLWRAVDQESCP